MLDGVMKFGVGQPVRRKEDDRFLRGAGQYVDDITEPGQAYAVFLRSPAAHAQIAGLDVSAARSAPGVLAVYTDSDAKAAGMQDLASLAPITNADGTDIAPVTHPHLARERVRYVGQPVAMVVAESLSQARDAAEMIDLRLEDLPAVVDLRAALAEGAPLLHPVAPNNRAYQWEVGDKAATEAAFAAAAHVVKQEVVAQRLIVNAMEPRAVNVKYDDAAGRWTVTCATQGSHAMRARISSHLGVEPERVRVITPDVGGGFGMKLMVHPEYAVCAMAAQKLGRPVKWTADRTESFLSDAQARDLWAEAEGAFDGDGRLLAMRFSGLSGLGAYYSQVGAAIHTIFSAPIMGGMYRLPTAYAHTQGVFTNTTPTDAYRGAGRPEVINLTEMVMDKAASAIGLDPAELRRRNLLTAADMPYKTWSGATYDSGDCVATLDRALEMADYRRADVRREQARAQGRLWGVGVVYYMERTGGGPNEVARIRIRGNGRVEALIGTQSTGQGHETAWAQIIHEKLGVDISVIDFTHGDSDALPLGGGTGGSRSLIMAHRTFFLAADDVIQKGREAAAERLEASVADIEFSVTEGGVFRVAGTDKTLSLFDVAAALEGGDVVIGEGGGELLGEGGVSDRESTYPNGAHVVEVEVDPETGWPHLKRYTIVDDFGRVLNPLLALGQVHGGVAQGVGQALLETAVWDPDTGQPLTGSFMDYCMPRADDFSNFDAELTEANPSTTNPLGVKGCGEAGSVGAIPAATLAVLDALRQAGAEKISTPLTPQKVWAALEAAKAASG